MEHSALMLPNKFPSQQPADGQGLLTDLGPEVTFRKQSEQYPASLRIKCSQDVDSPSRGWLYKSDIKINRIYI